MTGHQLGGLSGLGALLEPRHWDGLLRLGAPRGFEPREVLMRQGERAEAVMALLEGRVRISRLQPEGIELPFFIRFPGEVLGDIGVLERQPRTVTVLAVDRCLVRVVPATRFLRFLTDNALETLVRRHSNQRLQEAEQLRAELASQPVFQRLCQMLVRYATTDGPGRAHVDLGMSQEQLGLLIGASRNAVVGALARLRGLGIVSTTRETIVITDPAALRVCAERGAPD